MRSWPAATLALMAIGCSAVCGQAAPEADPLADLRQLFRTDPATAFEEAARRFEAPKAAGDLDGMMAIIRVVAPEAARCYYVRVLDDMSDAAAPVAREGGNWATLGELLWSGAQAWYACRDGIEWKCLLWSHLRAFALTVEAAAAYERAGAVPEAVAALLPQAQASLDAWQPNGEGYAWLARYGDYRNALFDIGTADNEGRDSEAVALALGVLQRLAEETDSARVAGVLAQVAPLTGLRGGEVLIPHVRRLYRPEYWTEWWGGARSVWAGCALGWSGRDDVLLDTFYWAFGQHDPRLGVGADSASAVSFGAKLVAFGREEEAVALLRRWLDFIDQVDFVSAIAPYMDAACPALEGLLAPDMRRRLLDLRCRLALHPRRDGGPQPGFLRALSRSTLGLPPAEQAAMALEAALRALRTAVQFERPEQVAEGMGIAAGFFDQAGRPDLAEQARALAEALRQSQPRSLLEVALVASQAAAGEGKWEQVVEHLEPAVSARGPAPERSVLQAWMLLAQAQGQLGRSGDAGNSLGAAQFVLRSMDLPPAERVSYLLSLAALSADATQKKQFLTEAGQAARESGLGLMEEGIAQQLVDQALGSGDLGTAREALLDIVQRQEQKRDRLAFDPLLRQQWFADSLGPYRKLLRVAALQGDAALALSCAEHMRSRALLDQLGWRKVDLAVSAQLPPELQGRLAALREARRQAYGLLNRAVGGSDTELEGEARGAYIPIRGWYIPIRGPLDEGKPLSAEEQTQLKGLLAELAREETALESAIRERIPAYAAASQVQLPAGEELAAAVSGPGLGVLEYTLCDEGLVCVALHGGQAPQVKVIAESGEALWERIGRFREAIWREGRGEEPSAPAPADGSGPPVPPAAAAVQARELYDLLVLPFSAMLEGAERLWVVADGALQLVPFGALRDGAGQYLAQRFAVAATPSLSLALWSRGARQAPEQSALIVAAPDTGAVELPTGDGGERGAYIPIRGMYLPIRGAYNPIRGEGGVSDALLAMASVPLPGAKAEGEQLAQQLAGAELLTGAAATKAALLQAGSTADILHIATHGYADPEVPEFSGVLLAGTGPEQPYEVLTAQEVYLWDLRARLVTLSACQTGLGQTVEGEGLLGLTRAFIYAGAQDVLCSLWPVSDESTAKLMTGLYAALQQGATVEAALQQAQQSLLADPATSHPFYWAGFIAVRGPE